MNSFHELILLRRSVRAYSSQPIERDKLNLCLEAAQLAPSACNAQPWRFVVVDDATLTAQIAEAAKSAAMGMNTFAPQAPVIVALVMEPANFTSKLGSLIKGKEFPLIDIGIAAEHFCLQAAELGLGTCMLGWFDEKRVKSLLGIPKSRRVPLLITVGYPKTDEVREKFRKPLDVISGWNKY